MIRQRMDKTAKVTELSERHLPGRCPACLGRTRASSSGRQAGTEQRPEDFRAELHTCRDQHQWLEYYRFGVMVRQSRAH
jgi:hypothetical protein